MWQYLHESKFDLTYEGLWMQGFVSSNLGIIVSVGPHCIEFSFKCTQQPNINTHGCCMSTSALSTNAWWPDAKAHNCANLWAAINTRSYCFLISSIFNGRHWTVLNI